MLQGEEKGARLRSHPAFVVGLNQPGMDGGTAAADADQHFQVIQSQLWSVCAGERVPAEVHARLWDPCRCYRCCAVALMQTAAQGSRR